MPSRALARRPQPQPPPSEARYLLHVVPGLEDIAIDEVRRALPVAQHLSTWKHFDERTSVLEYRFAGPARDLLKLGTVEDVFVLAARARALRTDQTGLVELGAAIARSRLLDRALSVFGSVHSPPRTFRVVARKAGTHAFRRVDAQRTTERAIRSRVPAMRLVGDAADVEFWLTIVDREALLGLRLSRADMRQHGTRLQTIPASLKPTIARGMVLLSAPRPSDVVLDPFCGAGTLLIERAAIAPAKKIHGGDIDLAAVELARQNAQLARSAIDVQHWDAIALPLDDRSVDVILTNPPFGKQVSISGDVSDFYVRVLAELERVLQPGGRLVLITSQWRAVRRIWTGGGSGMRITREVPVLLRGQGATIFVAVLR
jgi:tRNA (guanine6-N2)-methyltransferase